MTSDGNDRFTQFLVRQMDKLTRRQAIWIVKALMVIMICLFSGLIFVAPTFEYFQSFGMGTFEAWTFAVLSTAGIVALTGLVAYRKEISALIDKEFELNESAEPDTSVDFATPISLRKTE